MDESVTVETIVIAVMFIQASVFIAQRAIVRAIERAAVGAVGLHRLTRDKEAGA